MMHSIIALAKALLFATLVVLMHSLVAAPLFRRACRYYLDLVILQGRTDSI
jgi:hypothetical protein